MPTREKFQAMVQDLMATGNYSRKELGLAIGCSEQHIRNMEKNPLMPGYDIGVKIIELHQKVVINAEAV